MERDTLINVASELLAPQFILFNLSFVYIGMLFSPVQSSRLLILITLAFISARSAGVIMNRYIGRPFDLKNPKKAGMPSMRISRTTLILLFAALSAVFVFSAFLLNTMALALSPVVLVMLVIDPFSKRYSSKRHYALGLIQGFDVMGGYIGAAGAFPTNIALYLLMFAIIFIGGGFDAIYSITHVRSDMRNGLKTFASTKGVKKALAYSLYSHVTAVLFIMAFALVSRNLIILAGSVAASAVLLAQHSDINLDSDREIFARVVKYNTAVAIILASSVATAFFA